MSITYDRYKLWPAQTTTNLEVLLKIAFVQIFEFNMFCIFNALCLFTLCIRRSIFYHPELNSAYSVVSCQMSSSVKINYTFLSIFFNASRIYSSGYFLQND